MSNASPLPAPRTRAWYSAFISEFLVADPEAILGRLSKGSGFALVPSQRDAWLAQICLLRKCLIGLDGSFLMEFDIPRMGRRIDVVLLIGPVVFALEFKVGDSTFERAAIDQVWDYRARSKEFSRS